MRRQTRTALLTLCFLLLLLASPLAQSPALPAPVAAADQHHVFLPLVARAGAGAQPSGPSSDELIEAGQASGALDPETALVYHVYATFGDPRLPAQYRGDDEGTIDSHGLEETAQRWDDLAPATRALLAPFLVPPAYEGSWANQAPAPPAGLAAEQRPLCGKLADGWYYRDTANGHARIWWEQAHPEDGKLAYQLQQEYDGKIWRELRTYMGRSNHSDEDESCNGGDGRLDIYLVDLGGPKATKGLNAPYGLYCATTGPTFLQLNRAIPPAQLRSALAHEVMHAIQWAFPVNSSCGRTEYKWWQEATATWAMDYVYPQDNGDAEWQYAPDYLRVTELPLNHRGGNHEYGAYLFPFFLARTFGNDIVRRSWEAMATQSSLAALNSVIPGGLTKVWKEFALHSWNSAPKPYDNYATWDSFPHHAGADMQVQVALNGAPNQVYQLRAIDGSAPGLPPLTFRYFYFNFSDPAARGVTFFNGMTFEGQESSDGTSARIEMLPVPAAAREGVTVHALLKIGGAWRMEDWTEKSGAFFCRDERSERIEELAIVIGNGQWQNPDKVALPPGALPMVAVSNAGCYQWKGTVTSTRETRHIDGASHSYVSTTASVTYEQAPPIPGLPYGELGVIPSYHFLPSGVAAWEYENYTYNLAETDSPMCTEKGAGSFPIALGSDWHLSENYLTLYPGRIYKGPRARNYTAAGRLIKAGTVTRACIASPTETWLRDIIYFPNVVDANDFIAPGGTTITGRDEHDCSTDEEQCLVVTTWSLTSVAEP